MTAQQMMVPVHILLVEDDSGDAKAITQALAAKDPAFQIETVVSAATARARLTEQSYDMVILDYDLGDGTGLDLLPLVGETPAILLTGAGSVRIAAQALRMKASNYLIKDAYHNYLKKLPGMIVSAIAARMQEIRARGPRLADLGVLIADIVDNATASLKDIPATSAARARLERVVRSGQRADDLCQRLLAQGPPKSAPPSGPPHDS
jgi:DNA-binding NtrC family response regulator